MYLGNFLPDPNWEYVGGDAGGYWRHIYSGMTTVHQPMMPQPVYIAPGPSQIPSPTAPDGVIRTSPMPPKVIDPAAPSAPAPSALPPKITTIPPVNSNPAPSGGAMPFDDVTPGDASPRQLEPAAAPAGGVPWLLLASIAVAALG